MIDAAMQFAIEAHGDQKYGVHPYTYHLYAVHRVALSINTADGILSPSFVSDVAWLHDVVEDTDATVDELEKEFGRDRASAVALVTDPEGASRKERKAELHMRLSSLDVTRIDHRAALLVKLADRLSNVRASKAEGKDGLLKMYRVEHHAFRRATYRAGLWEDVWAELDGLMMYDPEPEED
jgi:(p)ppGpp synthase/HD superfamily hydrolase